MCVSSLNIDIKSCDGRRLRRKQQLQRLQRQLARCRSRWILNHQLTLQSILPVLLLIMILAVVQQPPQPMDMTSSTNTKETIATGTTGAGSTIIRATTAYIPPQPLFHRRNTSFGASCDYCSRQRPTTRLLGIKGFRSWFESQFPEAMTTMVKGEAHDTFDHVLIDMNQLLHIVLRKSKSETHALALLMQEVDACIALATPTQSLVLAFDGPPGAAKLATQRKRRFGTVYKTNAKLLQLDKLIASSNSSQKTATGTQKKNSTNGTGNSPASHTKQQSRLKQWVRKKARAVAETRTLCITPATEFMKLSEDAILYWAWQRLSARYTSLSTYNVKIFISSSTVPGEGEVKLLEWIYNKQRKSESVAILGGDSDLVLEALVIPLASTHNVFVLLPEGNKRYISVSLWETTRTLGRYMPHTTISSVIKVRTDLVLLLIFNGNDYLPKLRGSSGFNKLFHTYLRLQREWHDAGNGIDAYFVNPDTLQFNLPFAVAYFEQLAAMVPANVLFSNGTTTTGSLTDLDRSTPLQELNNLMDAGFFPKPMKFMVITDDGVDDNAVDEGNNSMEDIVDTFDDEQGLDIDGDDDDNNSDESDMMMLKLQMGEPTSEDFVSYEIWIPRGSSLKKGKHKLAAIALAELNDENDVGVDEDDDPTMMDGFDTTVPSYDWEIRHIAQGEIEPYLYGLLWNLQTYQDGVCADYSYNYGKRLSPLAQDIANYFQRALTENRTVGPLELRPAPFSPPVSAGLSCLAALPSPVKYLVPQPYRSIPDDTVEEYYSICMDPANNVFDINKFALLCEDHIATLNLTNDFLELTSQKSEHYWTIVSKVTKALVHPIDPPKPISERFAVLKENNKIRISRSTATAVPPRRSVYEKYNRSNGDKDYSHSYPGAVLDKLRDIEQVAYRVAFQNIKKKKAKTTTSRSTSSTIVVDSGNDQAIKRKIF